MPLWAAMGRARDHLLFDLDEDPSEDRNLAATTAAVEAEEMLRAALASVEAPTEQYERLGLT